MWWDNYVIIKFIGNTLMRKNNDRTVFKRNGEWHNKKDSSIKTRSIHATQKQAEDAARKILENTSGGGELKTKGVDGKIRSKDTINRPDPNPPIDTEN